MSVTLKVIGGTLGTVNKCKTCNNAQFMIDASNRSTVFCNSVSRYVQQNIVSCNSYRPLGEHLVDYALRSQAYTMYVSTDRTTVTFEPPNDSKAIVFKNGKRQGVKRVVSSNPRRRRNNKSTRIIRGE